MHIYIYTVRYIYTLQYLHIDFPIYIYTLQYTYSPGSSEQAANASSQTRSLSLRSVVLKDKDWSDFVNAKDDLMNTALVSADMRVQICCA